MKQPIKIGIAGARFAARIHLASYRHIGGVAVDSDLGWTFTQPFNLLSRCPALAVPTGRAATGVPTSLQIVGPPYGDEAVFAVAFHHAAGAALDLYRGSFPPLAA